MLRLPESPRKRARLIRGVSIGVVLLAIAAVSVRYRNAGHSYATPIDPSKPAVVIREPPHVPATRAMRRAAEATLATFARTALIRRDGETSWRLATPHMRVGTSHREWLTGALPVVPYPANGFRTSFSVLRYSYRGVLGYDVTVLPKDSGKGEQRVYACELHDLRGRWLVDFCYPRTSL